MKRSLLCLNLLVFAWLCAGASLVSAQPTPPEPPQVATQEARRAGPLWDGTLRRIRAPILMYHYVSELPAGADDTRRELTVSPAQFRSHLEYLFYEGYTPVSLYDLHDALLTGRPLPAKPVVLTFDDGYIDHYVHAFPALQERGFTGTFFLITSFIDQNLPGYVNWEQVRTMAEGGMSMEPHTKTHGEMDDMTYEQLVYETLGSIESVAHYTGRQPRMFSYPVGRYSPLALQVVGGADIWRAVTTQRGALQTTDNRLELPRLRVPGGADANTLAAVLNQPG